MPVDSKQDTEPVTSAAVVLPRVWVGHLIAGASLAVAVVQSFLIQGTPDENLPPITGATPFAFLLNAGGGFYWLFCVYRIHQILCQRTGQTYGISAMKAIGYHFLVPYNFYWIIKWPNKIAEFVRNQSPAIRVQKWWPGIVLIVSLILMGVIPPIALACAFSVLLYLTRKLEFVLRGSPERRTQSSATIRRQERSLAVSAGLGAGFSLLLYGAVWDLWVGSALERINQVVTIALVTLAAILFFEPATERLQIIFGVRVHHPPAGAAKSRLLRTTLFSIVVLITIAHTILHGAVEANPARAMGVLLSSSLVPATVTYWWMRGRRRDPPLSAWYGMFIGAGLSMVVLFADWLLVHFFGSAQVREQSSIPDLTSDSGQLTWIGNGFFWSVLGFCGGLVLDNRPVVRPSRRISIRLLLLSVVFATIHLVQKQPIIGCFAIMVCIAGWSAGLMLHPSADEVLVGKQGSQLAQDPRIEVEGALERAADESTSAPRVEAGGHS